MKISQQIRELVKHKNITITELASILNTTQGNLANKLIRDNFRLSDVKEISNALQYDDMEIILRGKDETVLISDDRPIKIIKDTRYLVYGDVASVKEEIDEYGINNTTFGEVVLALIEDELEHQYGNLWSTVIPKRLENKMIEMAMGIVKDVTDKFDTE